jgi:hypothetical protein
MAGYKPRKACWITLGLRVPGVILVTGIPFPIYDLVEAMDNVESTSVARDPFPTTRILTADGVISLMGRVLGNPRMEGDRAHAIPRRPVSC